jgi:hypothetical protein
MLSLVAGVVGFPAAKRPWVAGLVCRAKMLKILPLGELNQKAIKCNFFTQPLQFLLRIRQSLFYVAVPVTR